MKTSLRDEITIGLLLLALIVWMSLKGELVPALKFLSFVLLTYGSGMIIWSSRPLGEWKGWTAAGVGSALALYFNSSAVWAYSVAVFAIQCLAFVFVLGFKRWRWRQGDDSNSGDT